MKRTYLALIAVLAVSSSLLLVAEAQPVMCQPFQLYESPVAMYGAQKCSAFANSACCGFGIATRAYNWAKEDDGCGVVGGDCLQLLAEIACHTNCAPGMFVTTSPRTSGLRPAICRSWAQKIYNACGIYQWCTTTQEQASTCTFLKTSSTSVRRGGSSRYTGSKTITSTTVQNAWDTCTSVDDITLNEFARKILEVEVVDDASGNCSVPIAQPLILYNSAATGNASIAHWSLCMVLFVSTLLWGGMF